MSPAHDPFPNTADTLLEQRLRVLFEAPSISTKEPERDGMYFDAQKNRLVIVLGGRRYEFTPAS